MSNEKPIDPKVFVAANGMICPRCGSGDVSLSEPRVEGQSMFEDGECTACGCEFYTILRLVGYGLQGDSFVDGQENVFTIAEDLPEIQTGDEPVAEIKPVGPSLADNPHGPILLSCFIDGADHLHTPPVEAERALTELLKHIREATAATGRDQMPRRVGVEIVHNSQTLAGPEPLVRCFLESDLYAHEQFDPVPISEAIEQFRRLLDSTRDTVSQDGVTRRIGIEVAGGEESEDQDEEA